jgi:RNA polymerase sigma-70 factor (ECF subfamily)
MPGPAKKSIFPAAKQGIAALWSGDADALSKQGEKLMNPNDRETVKQCLNGHPEEYRRLVSQYENAVLSFLAGRLGSRERAEEASQETFVRAYFSLKDLKEPGAFFSWLLGIASRVAKEEQRAHRRNRPLAKEPPAAERDPKGADQALERAVANLPPPYRETVLLRYYRGLSCDEIARHHHLAIGTVTKRLSRAYNLLRASLREIDHEDMQRCSHEL